MKEIIRKFFNELVGIAVLILSVPIVALAYVISKILHWIE